MITERIDALNINYRGLFTAVYGVNMTPEVYVTRDLRKLSFHEALYLYLRQEGYITVFYDNQVWSYEEEMLTEFLLMNPQQEQTDDKVFVAGGKRDFFAGKGPMHKSRAKAAPQSVKDIPTAHHPSVHLVENGLSRYYTVLQDVGFFGTIYSVTEKFPRRKVAVIFVNPDTLEYDNNEQKIYKNNLTRLQAEYKTKDVGLKLIALYNHGWAQGFKDDVQESYKNMFLYQSPFKELILEDFKFLMDSNGDVESRPLKTVFFVTDPQRDEINNVMNRIRIESIEKGGLPDAFSNIPWDTIILRLWQSGLPDRNTEKGDKVKSLRAIKDFLDYPTDELNLFIKRMDADKAIDKLNALQGIDEVRAQFEKYRKSLRDYRKGGGKAKFRPHMVLMGSPGTGKTTVAKLFGDILREDGLLSKGHFVKVDVSELIGEFVGSTRPKTRAVCERAKGGVLFIDEAYGLMSARGERDSGADYGKEAIEVLIQFMEDNTDSLVILAGYTDEIEDLIDKGNKGFRRRFNELGFFHFRDYKPSVLYNISKKMITVPTTSEFDNALKTIISLKYAYRTKQFGNVGDMENLVSNIMGSYRDSCDSGPLDVRHLPDNLKLLVDPQLLDKNVILAKLSNLIGQRSVKDIIENLFDNCKTDREMLIDDTDRIPELPELNFIFTGNPGTGKTTIARIIGEMLQKMGILTSSKPSPITELLGSELNGKRPNDIKKLFEDNIGRVLFIDEAYGLKDENVITSIVGNITNKDYEKKLCIIMAGYTAQMSLMVSSNPGLQSRFTSIISFEDYNDEEMWEILKTMARNDANPLIIDEDCKEKAMAYFSSLNRNQDFGNAREVEKKLLPILKTNRNRRYRQAAPEQRRNKDYRNRIMPDDFPDSHSVGNPLDQGNGYANTETNNTGMQYDGEIDLSSDDQDKCVKEGADLYASVGLLDTGDGTGTAFVISLKNRYILTASHVVEGASQFKFTLNMQNSIMLTYAHLLWNSPMHDLALLQVDSLPDGAKYFAFDNTTARSPGVQIQIAAFPLGTQVSNTMLLTQGNIANYQGECEMSSSGRNRKFDAIRTDAQATHGSSGGPVMLKDNWKVIGVLHGGMSEGGFSVNVVTDSRQLFNDNSLKIRSI